MEATSSNDSHIVSQVDQFRLSSAKLGREGFKVDTVLAMMNNCADRCELRYYETGIQNAKAPGVECFKNCITKAYKLSSSSLQ
jgi:hypothetical protein